MKNRAFTLIELLVVVLIIGILIAIAVPQYKIAVKTSQLKSVLPIMKALAQAEESYYLANGKYAKNLTDLDINIDYTRKLANGWHYTSWGGFSLTGYITFTVSGVAQIEMPYDFPKSCARCYSDNDEICHKFGNKPNANASYRICQL